MIKRKITLTLLSIAMTQAVMAAPLSQADENKIASQCLSYLKDYGDTGKIPAKLANTAAPILGLCISHFSCQHKLLSSVSNCAHKLSNLALSAQVNSVTQSSKADQSPSTPAVVAPVPAPEPVTNNTPAQQPTTNTNKENTQKPEKKPSINWF